MFAKNSGVNTTARLLEKYRQSPKPFRPEKMIFSGVENRDVYNITAPFEDEGEMVIAGRVEARDREDSEVYFFVNRGGEWVPRKGAPVYRLQDPFYTKIGKELVFGGVQIFPHPEKKDSLSWRTVFYKGERIADLKEFAKGPDGMKDIRLIGLEDGPVGVFTRPQGERGGRGKIGFTRIPSIQDLTVEAIEKAAILEGLFSDEEWGGVNELHRLANGWIGVLGHIACFDGEGNRHYYPMVFAFNPDTLEFTEMEIIATRADFLAGPAKRSDLVDVVFSGGLIRNSDGTAELYAGVSDAEAQKITLADPFGKFEKEKR